MCPVDKVQMMTLLRSLGIDVGVDIDLSRISPIATGGRAWFWCEVSTERELSDVTGVFRDAGFPYAVIGRASNLLFPDGELRVGLIRLVGGEFGSLSVSGNRMTCGAGVSLARALRISMREGLSGLEGLAGIPASCGGASVTNASSRVSMAELLDGVKVIDARGSATWVLPGEAGFRYRGSGLGRDGSVVSAVCFRLAVSDPARVRAKVREHFARKYAEQPLLEKSLGCVFRNPGGALPAGKLLDGAGMKGVAAGGARYSEKHANFIVNFDNATTGEVLQLIDIGRERVREVFDIELERELEVLDVK